MWQKLSDVPYLPAQRRNDLSSFCCVYVIVCITVPTSHIAYLGSSNLRMIIQNYDLIHRAELYISFIQHHARKK